MTGSWRLHRATGCAIAQAAVAGAENVTLPLRHGDRVSFGGRYLEVRATPGHTDGCLSVVLDDHSVAFTDDALLVRGCGRCDFQQGDASTLYHSITEQLLSLPDHCLLYPADDYSGRLGGEADERDFVGYMENLHLPHPNRISVALPANLRSGRPADGCLEEADDWAPIERSYAGLPELTADWVADHREALTLVDVRSEAEVQGPDGRIPGSLLIPLPELPARPARSPRIGPRWCFATPAAAPPWPPNSCRRKGSHRWPTCAAACGPGRRRGCRWSILLELQHGALL